MLINKIDVEFRELNEIVGDKVLESLLDIIRNGKDIKSGDLLNWNHLMRELSKSEALVENRKFTAGIVQFYAEKYVKGVKDIFNNYDIMASMVQMDSNMKSPHMNQFSEAFYNSVSYLIKIIEKINMSNELISEIMVETWEPLPSDEEENNVQNIVISSETKSMSLNGIASDVANLDNFFKNISLLINQDQNRSNNIYLRRVETGSLIVAVSCAMEIAPIIAFIYWCVKLYQKTEKRYLDNADKKLEVIDKSINEAKTILKIDPNNMEANESIQRCAKHLLNFLENNPIGIINGEPYDIGIEKLKIEDKEDK